MATEDNVYVGPADDPVYTGTLYRGDAYAYDVFTQDISYKTMAGLLQLPLAGPPGTGARVVRVHAPYTRKVVKWAIQTVLPQGVRPVLPHWDTGDPNEVLCYRVVRPQTPLLTTAGTDYQWRVEGEYHYHLLGTADVFSTGTTPMGVEPPESFTLYEGDFSRELLRSSASVPVSAPVPADLALR